MRSPKGGWSTSDLPIAVLSSIRLLHHIIPVFLSFPPPLLYTTMPPCASFTVLAAILTLGTFLLFRRLSAAPAFYCDAFSSFGLGHSLSRLRPWLRDEDAWYVE